MMMQMLHPSLTALALLALRVSAQAPPVLNTTTIHFNLTGVYGPETFYTFQPVPFTVPPGCTSIQVQQTYDKGAGNSLDLGMWDPRGVELFDGLRQSSGFRGWSGGAKTNFTISPANASNGYIPGAIQAGTWYVMQGPYVVQPAGIHWSLEITLGFDPVDTFYPPTPPVARIGPVPDTVKWHRGDLHVHTLYSDGRHTPAEVVGFAQQANLNFFFTSEHNTNAANLFYGEITPPGLLVIPAIEVTTRAGHWQALGLGENDWVEFRYPPDGGLPGLEAAKNQVRNTIGGLAQINHPFIVENCAACNWTWGDWEFDAIEVWNGYWDETDQNAVDKWQLLMEAGNMLTATGGSDFHDFPVVVGTPTTMVRSDALTKAAIVEGIRRRRVIIVDGPKYDLTLCVRAGSNGECVEVGDHVTSSGHLELEIQTTGMEGAVASVFTQRGRIHEMSVKKSKETLKYDLPQGHKWVRVEVRNSTSMLGLTNVIVLDNNDNDGHDHGHGF